MNVTLFEGFKEGSSFEQGALIAVVVVALLGLLYAVFLTRQIMREPECNKTETDVDRKMKRVSLAIRTGGNAYLKKQFRTALLVIIPLAVFIFFTGYLGEIESEHGNP